MPAPRLAVVRRCLAVLAVALVWLGVVAGAVGASTGADDGDDVAETEPSRDDRADTVIEILPVEGLIDPPVAASITEVITEAEASDADLVVLQVTSDGGVSVDVDGLLETVRSSPVPVAVLVGPLGTGAEAAGAAGLLWLAADVRAVSADATVGPIDPVDLAAEQDSVAERVEELAADAGLDTDLAEALLTGSVAAPELADADAALAAEGLEPLLVELDGTTVETGAGEQQLRVRSDEVEVRFESLGVVRRLLHAATTGPFIYLLLAAGLTMLLFEWFQPGFGVAGFAGLITTAIGAFGVSVLPVTWWALGLVVLGLVLYAIDTAIAGFGPVTVAATAAFAWGSSAFYASEALALPGWLVAVTTLTVFVFFVFVLTVVLRAQAGPEGVAVDDLVGKVGTVRSVLNPEGHVYIDGALWRARWTGSMKRAKVGTPVRVHGVDGPLVLVDAFDAEARTTEEADAVR